MSWWGETEDELSLAYHNYKSNPPGSLGQYLAIRDWNNAVDNINATIRHSKSGMEQFLGQLHKELADTSVPYVYFRIDDWQTWGLPDFRVDESDPVEFPYIAVPSVDYKQILINVF